MVKLYSQIFILVAGTLLVGCGATADRILNPLQMEPPPEAYLGQPNSDSLNGSKDKAQAAREAFEELGKYQEQFSPSPNKPVLRPAIVRLMWIPDHLNRTGDLVPAHYYYLKVKNDEWAVEDAFDIYEGLQGSEGKKLNNPSNIPFVTGK